MFQKIKKILFFKLSKRAFWFWMIGIFIFGLIFAYGIYRFDIWSKGFQESFIKDSQEEEVILVESPLNGVKINPEIAELRPYAIMIENHPASRPHSGLDKASVIYEALAEGGITRFMALYLENSAEEIGPVRSARSYYLDWSMETKSFYVHAGGSEEALARIITDKIPDLNHDKTHFWRSKNRYSPHNLYTSTDKLKDYAKKRKYNLQVEYESGNFKKDAPLVERPETSNPIIINFSSYTYKVNWEYSRDTNEYLRFMAGSEHKDAKSDTQLSAKAIIVQFIPTTLSTYSPGKKILDLETIGRGKVLIFQDGGIIEGEWKKDSKTSRTVFLDSEGNVIRLVAGVHWFEIVKTDIIVSY